MQQKNERKLSHICFVSKKQGFGFRLQDSDSGARIRVYHMRIRQFGNFQKMEILARLEFEFGRDLSHIELLTFCLYTYLDPDIDIHIYI